jgi:hypothetical protein
MPISINKIILTALVVLIPAGSYFYQAANTPDALLRKGLETSNQELVTESIKQGARLYEANHRARTQEGAASPVSLVAFQGDIPKMKLLLQGGADVNRADYAGLTPLHYAAGAGHAAMVVFLLDAGADIKVKTPDSHSSVANLLLEIRPPSGTTPLMMAATKNSDSCVQTLLERGADAKVKNSHGETALQIVQRMNAQRSVPSFHTAKVVALLKYGPAALKSKSSP